MAARRDRERRRPAAERRYRFGTPEVDQNQAVEPDDTLGVDEQAATGAVETRPRRSRAIAKDAASSATRGGSRAAPRPFSAYKAEYAYVFGDLRRVSLVIGSLLLILLLLYVALPR
jgi:hypothetical protein